MMVYVQNICDMKEGKVTRICNFMEDQTNEKRNTSHSLFLSDDDDALVSKVLLSSLNGLMVSTASRFAQMCNVGIGGIDGCIKTTKLL